MISSDDAHIVNLVPTTTASGWSRQIWIYLFILFIDVVAIFLGLGIAYNLRFQSGISLFYDPGDSVLSFYLLVSIAVVPIWLSTLAIFQLYNSELLFGGLEEYARVFNACTTAIMFVVVGTFLLPNLVVSRGWLLLSWFSVTALIGIGRFAVRRGVYSMRRRGRFLTPMLIVGADDEGRAIAEQLSNNRTSGVRLLGFVDDELPKGTHVSSGLRVLGSTDSLEEIVQYLSIEEMTISSNALDRNTLVDIFHTFGTSDKIKVRLSSGLFEIVTTGLRVKDVGHVPLLSVNRVRLTGVDVLLKTILDYAGAIVGLVVLSPLFLLIGVAIKLDSQGPVFHRRRVAGVGRMEFDAFKFRTMVAEADRILQNNEALKAEFEENFKLREDPRVTSVGSFLRKTSIDEFPQLFNVLRGEMSLVGPRMITRDELDKYGKWSTNLMTVKPGITGLWQVSGRSDVGYDERVRLDMHYIRNYTIWLDLQILVQTVPAVLRKDGAY